MEAAAAALLETAAAQAGNSDAVAAPARALLADAAISSMQARRSPHISPDIPIFRTLATASMQRGAGGGRVISGNLGQPLAISGNLW